MCISIVTVGRRMIACWLVLAAGLYAVAGDQGRDELSSYDAKVKALLKLDAQYSAADAMKKRDVIKTFTNGLQELTPLPLDETEGLVEDLFLKLRNIALISAVVHTPPAAQSFACELVDYAGKLGTEERRKKVFAKNQAFLDARRGFDYKHTTLDELKKQASKVREFRKRVRGAKSDSLYQKLILSYATNHRESRASGEGWGPISRIKGTGMVTTYFTDYFVHLPNMRLLRDDKGILKLSFLVKRKSEINKTFEIHATISSETDEYCFVFAVDGVEKLLSADDKAKLKSLKESWTALSVDQFSRIYGYVITVGRLKPKDTAYSDYDSNASKRGWIGLSRHSKLLYSAILNSGSFEDLSLWRRILECCIDDDVMYSIHSISEDKATEKDEYVIGEKTAKRIRVLHDILAKQTEPYKPGRILSALAKRNVNSKYPLYLPPTSR